MERIFNDRLAYYVEKRGYVSRHQSGFRRGRNTVGPVLCLEHEIRKSQANKKKEFKIDHLKESPIVALSAIPLWILLNGIVDLTLSGEK